LTVSKDSPREFEIALEEAALDPESPQPFCVVWQKNNPGKPNPWIDWGSNTDEREDYERTTPTKQDALDLCDGCPFYNLCTDAAIAKPPYHGVRGAGLRFENGRRLK
jgi:hypothetical protein